MLLAFGKKLKWKQWTNSLKNYKLCPSHYLSATGLSWDAMLKMTKIELQLIPDPDMYIFTEKGTRDAAKPTINI